MCTLIIALCVSDRHVPNGLPRVNAVMLAGLPCKFPIFPQVYRTVAVVTTKLAGLSNGQLAPCAKDRHASECLSRVVLISIALSRYPG